jgi:hypothetical protein
MNDIEKEIQSEKAWIKFFDYLLDVNVEIKNPECQSARGIPYTISDLCEAEK